MSVKRASAARTINSATLNGASSVTVAPGASITAAINVTTSGGGASNDWNSTSWNITGSNCVNHANHLSSGTFNESFSITAPGSPGTYSVSFIAHQNDTCSQNPSATLTLSNSINVVSPTPTPTPSLAPTPTPTPTSIPTPTPSTSPSPTPTLTVTTPTPTPPPGSTSTPTPTPGPGSTSTPTPTPGNGNSDSSTSSVAYYPSINIQRNGLTFTGTASISNGSIGAVEFSLDSGNTWKATTPADGSFNTGSENYSFTPNVSFPVGPYTVLARAKSQALVYTQSSDYASVSFNVTPPTVVINSFSQNPTSNINPAVSGTASSTFSGVARVEVSSDGGETWLPANYSKGVFQINYQGLEDGNYNFITRAFDSFGNLGISETETLVVDTIPPAIGGNMFSLGPQLIIPDKDGLIQTVAGAEIALTISTRGGVTEGEVVSGSDKFPLINVPGTNFWTAYLHYNDNAQNRLQVIASDGAGNKTQRELNNISVEALGTVADKTSDQPVKDATVKIFFFDKISNNWVVWDGYSFGQDNPQKTDNKGRYSFLVPPGRYYIEISASGYRTANSQIMDLSQNTVLNFKLPLKQKAFLSFTLPIVGKIRIYLPYLGFDSINVTPGANSQGLSSPNPVVGKSAPPISLPDISGKTVNVGSSGKKYVLSFVSQWASGALEQIPILDSTSKKISGDQIIYAVFLQDSQSSVVSFMKRGNYSFNSFSDKNGDLTKFYPVTTLPQHFFIGSDGKIQTVLSGLLSESQILEELSKLK